jgi:arylsulfatase A-like enzyme
MNPSAAALFLTATATLAACAPARGGDARDSGPDSKPKRPNIVLILADDVGWGDIGFNGRKSWDTPNLDRLAAQGVTLRRFYAGAVVCAPSRGVLMTGKYTIHAGVSRNNDDLPAEQTTIAEALKARGYDTALFGKWHHGKPPAGQPGYTHPLDQGFDEFFGFTDAVDAWQKFPEKLWEGREQVPVSGYADDLFAARGVEFIRRHEASDRPFFLYLPLISGHFLIQAPEDEVAKHLGRFPERENRKPLYATYAAQITRLDRHVGQVMEALDAAGLADDTLLVFTSDHGATFESGNQGTSAFHDSNAPFRGQKRTVWEGGIRVPACARWPGHIPAGSESAAPMHMADLFPTFCDATGLPPEPALGLDGVDLLPLWTADHPVACPERTLFWEWRSEGSNQLAAMRGRFKLVVTEGGKPELFDVEADPAERRNVAASHPLAAQALHKELKAWLATEPQSPVPPVAAGSAAR